MKEAKNKAAILRLNGYETEISKSKNKGVNDITQYIVWGWMRIVEFRARPGRRRQRYETDKRPKETDNASTP